MWCMCLFVEDASGYYDNDDSESAGPQLEAVVTIPIHAGRGAGAKGQDKSSGYTRIHLPSTIVVHDCFALHSPLYVQFQQIVLD